MKTCLAIQFAIVSAFAQPTLGPAFVGVPPFTGQISTDPFWFSRSGWIYDSAWGDSTRHTNSAGTPSMRLEPLAAGRRSDLYCTVKGDGIPHAFSFWFRGSLNGSQLDVAADGQLPSIYAAPETWTQSSHTIPATTNSVTLAFTLSRLAGPATIWIDAVQWVAVVPPDPVIVNTNFVIRLERGVVWLAWRTNLAGYTLTSSTDVQGPFAAGGYTMTETNGWLTTAIPAAGKDRFFRLTK